MVTAHEPYTVILNTHTDKPTQTHKHIETHRKHNQRQTQTNTQRLRNEDTDKHSFRHTGSNRTNEICNQYF